MPLLQPNCRSTTKACSPEDEEDGGERIAKDKEGKRQYVQAAVNYEKWYNTYVNEHKIDIEIDGFPPCLEDPKTGKTFKTTFGEVNPTELQGLKKKGWLFDWPKENSLGYNVYALRIEGDKEIQGLISWYSSKDKDSIEVPLAESAPHNRIEKKYTGVGAHLFAIAALKSFELGHGGFVTLTAKTKLIKYYEKVLGARLINSVGSMYLGEDAARMLVEKFFGEGDFNG